MSALATIHVAKKALGLDDDTYRLMLVRVTGKPSAKAMSETERQAVVAEMRRQGFKAASKAPRKGVSGPYAKVAQALWIALYNLGAVEDRRDSALIAFIRRQTGIERPEWVLDAKDGRAVVQALKSWTTREGVDWTPSRDAVRGRDGYRIAVAQWAKLGGTPGAALWAEISKILARPIVVDKPDASEWIIVMNALGKRVRASDTVQSMKP